MTQSILSSFESFFHDFYERHNRRHLQMYNRGIMKVSDKDRSKQRIKHFKSSRKKNQNTKMHYKVSWKPATAPPVYFNIVLQILIFFPDDKNMFTSTKFIVAFFPLSIFLIDQNFINVFIFIMQNMYGAYGFDT